MAHSSDPTVVILGDWFLDENWLVDKQSLPHSSFTGERHYRAHQERYNTRLIGACGAPLLMQLIDQHRSTADGHYQLLGYGAWNPHDDRLLRCVLCPKYPDRKLFTPYTLVARPWGGACPNDESSCLYSDSGEDCEYAPKIFNLISDRDAQVSTHRIIRGFRSTHGGEPRQLFRIDWQLDYEIPKSSSERMYEDLRTKNVRFIVIQDHGYGVVTRESVRQLLRLRAPDGKRPLWFLRTKRENPEWLQDLVSEQAELDLIVTDHKIAEYTKGRRQWWHGPVLGRAALEILGELTGDFTYRHGIRQEGKPPKISRAAVLIESKEGNTAFAKHGCKCYDIRVAPYPRTSINIGRTTVFYAALVAQRLAELTSLEQCGSSEADRGVPFGEQCFRALAAAHGWGSSASRKWREEDLCIYDGHESAVRGMDAVDERCDQCEASDYARLWEDWNASSRGLGTFVPEGRGGEGAAAGDAEEGGGEAPSETLQMLRGEGALSGYICVGGPKRDEINGLVAGIARYCKETSPRHPLNCLLIGRPGWGKSFLAKCLAGHFDLDFLEFSLAQMCEHRDLIECLATIASAQNRSERRTLVFMDEVNAQIEGHSALGLLLDPLWNGTFIKDGRAFRLRPAVWIFASTSPMRDLASGNVGAKGLDFISRLNGPTTSLDSGTAGEVAGRILRIQEKLLDESVVETLDKYCREVATGDEYVNLLNQTELPVKTEQVYTMVFLLESYWGRIRRVEKSVLQLFHDLLPINGFRSLEFLAGRFEGVRRGEIRSDNVPDFSRSPELRRHVVVPEVWLMPRGQERSDALKGGREAEFIVIDSMRKGADRPSAGAGG